MTYTISVDGKPVASVSADGLTPSKRVKPGSFSYGNAELVDDDRLMRLILDGQTILVFYVSAAKNIEVSHD